MVEEHRLLTRRQRRTVDVGDPHLRARAPAVRVDRPVDQHCQLTDRAGVEDGGIIECCAHRVRHRCDHLERSERISTEIEEVVGDADLFEAQHLGPDLTQ